MRDDLAALTPQAIAALANMGLVKRAQRELAAGGGPRLEELDDGTVVGTFPDGVVAKLPAGTALADAPCTCGASAVCRHRVAVALAYGPFCEARAGAPAAAPEPWSPADLSDDALTTALGARIVARGGAIADAGLLVEIDRGTPPAARLPTCGVRFLVPRELAYARCDCAAGSGCEHVVIAVLAFRAATADETIVRLGKARASRTSRAATETPASGAAGEAAALAAELVTSGVAHAPPDLAARFARVRERARRAGLTWIAGALEDLEAQVDAYARRSALYRARAVAEHAAEIEARRRASERGTALPARFVLGADEAAETDLGHTRLVSLGVRLAADGGIRFADVFLADPDAAMVLVLRKRFDADVASDAQDGAALARRAVAPRVTLGALATGQLVSKALRRRANRSVLVGATRGVETSVTPQRGEWGALPPPILVDSVAALATAASNAPPRALRPRVLAEHVHAIAVGSVRHVGYVASEQELVADLEDPSGQPFLLRVRHRSVARNAVSAAARALARPVHFVAGEVRAGPRGIEVDATAIAGRELVVPELSPPQNDHELDALEASNAAAPRDDEHAMASVERVLEEVVHLGLVHAARWRDRCTAAARTARATGFSEIAARLDALAGTPSTEAWFDAFLLAWLVRERLGRRADAGDGTLAR